MTIQMGSSRGTNTHKDFTTPTDNQIAALERYAEYTSLPLPLRDGIKHYLANKKFTFSMASETIGMIKGYLDKEEQVRKVEEGVYLNPESGKFFQVRKARGSSRLYAMKLSIYDEGSKYSDGTWERRPQMEWIYVTGLIRDIDPEWRITEEQAKAFGDKYNTCIKCGLELSKPESIERGMGPVCAKRI